MTHPDKQAALEAAKLLTLPENAGMVLLLRGKWTESPDSGGETSVHLATLAQAYLAQAAELERLRERMAYAAGKPYQECIHVLRAALKKAE